MTDDYGQYHYIRTRGWHLSSHQRLSRADGTLTDMGLTYLQETVVERWVPAPPEQECTQRNHTTGEYQWVVGDDEKAREAGLELPKPDTMELRVPCGDFPDGTWQRPSTGFLAALPRDPGALLDRLRRDTEGKRGDPDLRMLEYVADALQSGLVPAELRTALYRVLAEVPGVEVVERVPNLDGREGTAYGLSRAGRRREVFADPDTGHYLGERHVAEDEAQVPAGTVTSFTAVSLPVVVDSIPPGGTSAG
ncbi:CU044_5270 family protein [Actinophytocola gossypii]|uniref:CU044_5270 family protein n=1 Tax=Actinophytocola gossypii TaxID=2812003 RepID=A0ABT2JHU3_9PSEU|nr:CU044_5270 family protein [Actinophytocola gossypii]MCT2587341.1 CU044_5270 family protein [Actinophytocola gossypii]